MENNVDYKTIKLFSTGFFAVCFLFSSLLFLGCSGFYELIGIDPTTSEQMAKQDAIKFVEETAKLRVYFWETVSAGTAILGALLSGYLGIRLNNSAKVTKAVVRGVEIGGDKKTKEAIESESIKLRVGEQLQTTVTKLT